MPFYTPALIHFLPRLIGYVPRKILLMIPEINRRIPTMRGLDYPIHTSLRLAHFLSQCAHESSNFKYVRENLNYSEATLIRLFGKYFPDSAILDQYAYQPEKIASRIYAQRMGNGTEASKEGYIFRGRGYIQLTGKNNYADFSRFIGQDCVNNPDWVATRYPLLSAAFFFHKNHIWPLCDQGTDREVVAEITRHVNGGTQGLTERIRYFQHFATLLNLYTKD